MSEYTSYEVEAENCLEDRIKYHANDPKSMFTTKTVSGGGGLFSRGKKTEIVQEYTMNGAVHHDGPVSTRTMDRSISTNRKGEKKISAKTIECIKARGSGEGTGRMVGGSVECWFWSLLYTMIGMNEGAEIGGDIAESFSDACRRWNGFT